METEMQKLQDTADLFEVNFPDYKQLRQCRSDIILVKAVWDMVIFVKVNKHTHTCPLIHVLARNIFVKLRPLTLMMKSLFVSLSYLFFLSFLCLPPFQTSIEDWTKTPWKEINVELMDMELRRFAKVTQWWCSRLLFALTGLSHSSDKDRKSVV